MGKRDYKNEELKQIIECARRSLFNEKYQELLYFAVIDDDTPQNRALFNRAIQKYIRSEVGNDGKITSPAAFDKKKILQEMRELSKKPLQTFRVIFGVATIDGEEYLPKKILLDGYKYERVDWPVVRQKLIENDELPQFFNVFARTVRPADILAFADDRLLTFSSEDFYGQLEKTLARQIYYSVTMKAISAEVATEMIDASFGKILWAASAAWVMTSQSTTWNVTGELTRRAPAMMSGAYLVAEEADNKLMILQDTIRIVKAEQALLSKASKEGDRERERQYQRILGMLRESNGNIARTKLAQVARVLYSALSSNNANSRHLELWQCIELGVGWRRRKEIEVVRTLKQYYDPGNTVNAPWAVTGDYVHAKRCEYVHESAKLKWDSHGTYDSALNLYMDYVRVALMILMYFGDEHRTNLVRSEEDFQKLMKYYAEDNSDLAVAKWLVEHRRGKG